MEQNHISPFVGSSVNYCSHSRYWTLFQTTEIQLTHSLIVSLKFILLLFCHRLVSSLILTFQTKILCAGTFLCLPWLACRHRSLGPPPPPPARFAKWCQWGCAVSVLFVLLLFPICHVSPLYRATYSNTRWFKYDRDDLCVNKSVCSGHIWTTLYISHFVVSVWDVNAVLLDGYGRFVRMCYICYPECGGFLAAVWIDYTASCSRRQ
jgi:hypothetical protein